MYGTNSRIVGLNTFRYIVKYLSERSTFHFNALTE